MAYRLITFGPVEIRSDGDPVNLPPGKPFALLTYLVLSGTRATREDLARLLWPDVSATRARQSLRHALWKLRQVLSQEILEESDPLVVAQGLVQSDVGEVHRFLDRGDLDSALDLYRGRFLEDLAVPDAPAWAAWVQETDARIRARLAQALLARALEHRATGKPDAALTDIRRALDIEPYRPAHHAALVETLLELSRLDEAAAGLESARSELGDLDEAGLNELASRLDTLSRRRAARPSAERTLPFVGRDADLLALMSSWRAVETGSTRVAMVRGEIGMGKTRLAEEVRRQVEASSGAVVWAQATEPEQNLDRAVAAELVRHLISMPGAAGISAASDRLLRSLVPILASGDPVVGRGGAALAEAFVDLLSAVAYERPLLVVLENAHWTDPSSLALLHRAVRQLEGDPVLLLLTARTEIPAPGLDAVTDAFRQAGTLDRVRLQPLELDAVADILTASIPAEDSPPAYREPSANHGDQEAAEDSQTSENDGAPRVDPALAAALHRVSGGVPLLLFDALDTLRSRSRFTRDRDTIRLEPGAPSELELSPAGRAILYRRVDALSDDAARMAGVLAARGGTEDPRTLARATGLGARADAAVDELKDRGVVGEERGAVAFAHPLLRAEARRRFGATEPTRWRRWTTAAAVILALVAAATYGVYALGPPAGPPYGGGTLYLHTVDTVLAVEPRDGSSPWQAGPAPDAPPATPATELRGPFRTTDGNLLWYRRFRHPEGPYVTQILPNGTHRTVIRTNGDDDLGGPSPDGRYLLYWTENLATERYDLDLYIARSDGSQARRIYAGEEKLRSPVWSPDGRRIAFGVRGMRDTLAVITPSGRRLRSFVFDRVSWLDWCAGGRRLAAEIRRSGRSEVLVLDVESDSVRHLGAGRTPSCSPDGRAVAYLGLEDRTLRPMVQDISTGRHIPILTPGVSPGAIYQLAWVPDAVDPVPTRLQIIDPAAPIYWGSRIPLRTRVRFSDGRAEAVNADWTSLNTAVAFVDSAGTLYANREGRARVVATYEGWLTDTLDIAVRPGGPQRPLLTDPLVRLDTARWSLLGEPHPAAAETPQGPVLSMRGDGRYTDGILAREPVPVGRGATVELEFRIEFTRRSQQRIQLMLGAVETHPLPTAMTQPDFTQLVKIIYPADELLKFDPRALDVAFHNGYRQTVRLPDVLPPDGWIHLALQVDASGAVQVIVGREPVLEADLRLPIEPGSAFHVGIAGAAVDTELLVRNLVVWEGVRYGG